MSTIRQPLQNHPPVLVIDSNGAAAERLAHRIRRGGFETDIATSCWAAHTAIRAKRYGTLVVVANLGLATDLECLCSLRASMRRTWFIVIISYPLQDAYRKVLSCGADSLLVAPFAIEELLFRLSAFSHRSRPP